MGKRIGLLVAVFSLVWGANAKAQSESVPYIYYFADRLNTFIVERADGTDTRILGDGLMHRNMNYSIAGPGWSPSGRWFAWTAAQGGGYSQPGPAKPFVIRSDGTRRLTLLDERTEASMAWAPHDDLLLVSSKEGSALKSHTLHVDLIDPASNAAVVSVTIPQGNYGEDDVPVMWTSDGYGIAQYGVAASPVDRNWKPGFVILDTHGKTFQKVYDALLSPTSFSDVEDPPAVSATGEVAYPQNHSLVVENVITGRFRAAGPVSDDPFGLEWSPDGRFALLYGKDARLLTVATGQVQVILPSFTLPDGPLEGLPVSWSLDSRYAVFGANRKIYSLATETAALQQQQMPVPFLDYDGEPDLSPLYWLRNDRLVVPDGKNVHVYDLNAGTEQVIAIPDPSTDRDSNIYQNQFSPDERSLAYITTRPAIYDIGTGRLREIRPAADGHGTGPGGNVSWSKDGRWLLLFEDARVTEGDVINAGIMRADGEMRRDLTFQEGPSPNSINWLPDQVKPEYLLPPIPKPLNAAPVSLLHGSEWAFNVRWSPDGKEIAGGLGTFFDNGAGNLSVWNVASGKIVQSIPNVTPFPQVSWQADPRQGYVAVAGQRNIPERWGKSFVTTFSPDGKLVMSQEGNGEGILTIFDAATHQTLHLLDPQTRPLPMSASFSPDDKLLAVGMMWSPSKIYDVQTGNTLFTFPHAVYGVAFSPDGRQIAANLSWDIGIWNVADLLQP